MAQKGFRDRPEGRTVEEVHHRKIEYKEGEVNLSFTYRTDVSGEMDSMLSIIDRAREVIQADRDHLEKTRKENLEESDNT